jgi:putative hemolysin
MISIVPEIIIIVLLILLNGFLSMSETAIVSTRKTRFQQLADEGDPRARTALALLNNPPRFLSTVQSGITLVGILMGVFGGTTIAGELARLLDRIPFIAPWSGAISVALVVLLITYFSIVVGELIPKQLALLNSEKIALAVARTMRLLASILMPLVRVLSASSGGVLKLFGVSLSRAQPVSEEEIKVMIDQGIEHGMFEEAERDMIEGVFELGDARVNELMTPRTDIAWLDVEDSPGETRQKINDAVFSRFPVCRGGLDTVLGVVRAKEILAAILRDDAFDLKKLMRPPLYVPENALALKLLENFKKSRNHVALAVDEYGVVAGLITIYDILESIVGDIPSVDEIDEPLAVQRKDGSWLLDGLLPMDTFKEMFGIDEVPEEGSYQTLGGFIMMHLGKIPATADSFEWGAVRLEVVDMDGNRVDKVLATTRKEKAEDGRAEGEGAGGKPPGK